jgi:hypothetical protein
MFLNLPVRLKCKKVWVWEVRTPRRLKYRSVEDVAGGVGDWRPRQGRRGRRPQAGGPAPHFISIGGPQDHEHSLWRIMQFA